MGNSSAAAGSGSSLRPLHLSLLCASEEAQFGRFRSLRLSALLLALSGVLGVSLVAGAGAADVADVVALRVVAYAAWLYGLLGLPALMNPRIGGGSVRQLAALRGYQPRGAITRAAGRAGHLFFGMALAGLPGLMVAVLVSPSVGVALQRTALVPASALYLLVLAACLAAVAWLGQRMLPRTPRTGAVLIVVGPWALSWVWPEVPNLVTAFSWALGQLIAWGGAVS